MASDHALRLGKLLGNLQSLEALLRIYLLKVGTGASLGAPAKKPYWDLLEGEVVDDDEFTNYDSLGQLIAKYNMHVTSRFPQFCVSTEIVKVRDLLAHGRVAGTSQDTTTLKILKFTKPKDGKAIVTTSNLMDDSWFDLNIALSRAQIENVARAINS